MTCVSGEWWVWAYWFGVLVYGGSIVEKLEVIDIAASYLAALAWPVSLPARILRRLMR